MGLQFCHCYELCVEPVKILLNFQKFKPFGHGMDVVDVIGGRGAGVAADVEAAGVDGGQLVHGHRAAGDGSSAFEVESGE